MVEHVSQMACHTNAYVLMGFLDRIVNTQVISSNISPSVFSVILKWKTKTYHPVRTIPKSNIEIIAPNTQVNEVTWVHIHA